MKIIVVEYPFPLDDEARDGGVTPPDASCVWHYPTMRQALADARDRFQARDEYEDAQDLIASAVDPLSRKAAAAYEIDVTVLRSWVCDLLNTGRSEAVDGGSHVTDLRYRKGKIVASKPVARDADADPADGPEGE